MDDGVVDVSEYDEHPGMRRLARFCEGEFVGFVWVKKRVPPLPGSADAFARQVAGEIHMPAVEVKVNPTTGLAGFEAWFWAEGYSGQPVIESRDALGRKLEVEATPARFRWDFGDGTGPVETTSLGQAYPQRSEIRHVYENINPGYPVTVTFVFNVRYRIDGGPWIDLDPIERSATTPYHVREIRTVITSRS